MTIRTLSLSPYCCMKRSDSPFTGDEWRPRSNISHSAKQCRPHAKNSPISPEKMLPEFIREASKSVGSLSLSAKSACLDRSCVCITVAWGGGKCPCIGVLGLGVIFDNVRLCKANGDRLIVLFTSTEPWTYRDAAPLFSCSNCLSREDITARQQRTSFAGLPAAGAAPEVSFHQGSCRESGAA